MISTEITCLIFCAVGPHSECFCEVQPPSLSLGHHTSHKCRLLISILILPILLQSGCHPILLLAPISSCSSVCVILTHYNWNRFQFIDSMLSRVPYQPKRQKLSHLQLPSVPLLPGIISPSAWYLAMEPERISFLSGLKF